MAIGGLTSLAAWELGMQTVGITILVILHARRKNRLTSLVECAKRWHHSLDPSLNHSEWSLDEDERLLVAVDTHGRSWKTIQTKEFPGRSATDLKNRSALSFRRLVSG